MPMPMPIELILVRHGESEGNVASKKSHDGDDSAYTDEFKKRPSSSWHLTELGRKHAIASGDWIKENIRFIIDRYYVSEYVRAVETAALLDLSDADWFKDFYLRERDQGQLDVMSEGERRDVYAKEMARRKRDGVYWAAPGGESMANLCLRIDRVLHTLYRDCYDKRVIIVCHGEVMRAFRVRLERMSQSQFYELHTSRDPSEIIHNGQILHYSRRHPETRKIDIKYQWMRSVWPYDLSVGNTDWRAIKRLLSPKALSKSKP